MVPNKRRSWTPLILIITGIATLFLFGWVLSFPDYARAAEADDYDRLDGRGKSGKRVDVIEWAGNLEVHVYPGGGLAGLALKIDEKLKDKKVMIIGYRFNPNSKEQHIRRAILSIPIAEPFKVYRDKSITDYDKIIISNNVLSDQNLAFFNLDPKPTQDYPEGYDKEAAGRAVAGEAPGEKKDTKKKLEPDEKQALERKEMRQVDEGGTVRPFSW